MYYCSTELDTTSGTLGECLRECVISIVGQLSRRHEQFEYCQATMTFTHT